MSWNGGRALFAGMKLLYSLCFALLKKWFPMSLWHVSNGWLNLNWLNHQLVKFYTKWVCLVKSGWGEWWKPPLDAAAKFQRIQSVYQFFPSHPFWSPRGHCSRLKCSFKNTLKLITWKNMVTRIQLTLDIQSNLLRIHVNEPRRSHFLLSERPVSTCQPGGFPKTIPGCLGTGIQVSDGKIIKWVYQKRAPGCSGVYVGDEIVTNQFLWVLYLINHCKDPVI